MKSKPAARSNGANPDARGGEHTNEWASKRPSAERRSELLVFLGLWLAFGAFHQGGGWNQNARLAQVRSVVEEGRLSIDDYLVYLSRVPAGADWVLGRARLSNGTFRVEGTTFSLAWQDADGTLSPMGPGGSADARLVAPVQAAVSGDLSFFEGHFFPNKAPGVLAAAILPYLVLSRIESYLGVSPDRWWILTVNAWLTTAASVSLWAALGGVAFFRLSRRLVGASVVEALASTLAFGLGTLYWPCGTLLQEQDLATAALALAALLLMPRVPSTRDALVAGLLCALSVAASYVAILCVGCVGAYLLLRHRRVGPCAAFGLGFGLGLLPLLFYHWLCFGGPLTSPYAREDPAFRAAGALLGVIELPDVGRLAALLVSPFRGAFFTSPVLVAGLAGSILAWRVRQRRLDVALCLAVFGSLVVFNVGFNGWHGGWTTGPRYLVPAFPFLALWWPLAWRRWRRTVLALSVLSIAIQFLATGVDPQPPVGAGDPGRPLWLRSALLEHDLPLFLGLRPGGDLAVYYAEPVSSNPVGVYEAWYGRLFPVASRESRWNSFNAGEFLLPGSRWSLLFVTIAVMGCLYGAFWFAQLRDRGAEESLERNG